MIYDFHREETQDTHPNDFAKDGFVNLLRSFRPQLSEAAMKYFGGMAQFMLAGFAI